jgi:hypothetical protein
LAVSSADAAFSLMIEKNAASAPLLSCVGFGWYEERAMGQRKGEWVQGQVGEEADGGGRGMLR